MSLTDRAFSLDLAESIGPDLRLSALLASSSDELLEDPTLSYGTARGDATLRELIAQRHGVRADQVVVTVGGMHALFLLSMILARGGSEVVTLQPSFPSAHQAIGLFGAQVRSVSTNFEQGYQLDVEELCTRLSSQTTLVTIASPQNPSGVTVKREAILAVSKKMESICPDAYLLVDETYREAGYDNEAPIPSALDLHPKIVSCSSLSKCHGAPGLRIGWAITHDQQLRDQLERGKFASVIACSTIDESLAVNLLQRSRAEPNERRSRLGDGLRQVQQWVSENADLVQWVRPNAGALCCVRLDPTRFDVSNLDSFHLELARLGTRVSPGPWFGDEPHIFRLGFGLPDTQQLAEGLTLLSKAINSLRPSNE